MKVAPSGYSRSLLEGKRNKVKAVDKIRKISLPEKARSKIGLPEMAIVKITLPERAMIKLMGL